MADQQPYYLKGHLLGACSCDWGCPCVLKPVRPKAFVRGITCGILRKGIIRGYRWQAVPSGFLFVFLAHHMKATGPGSCWWTRPSQTRRPVLESMIQSMPPFSIFWSLLSTFLGFRYVPFALHLDGIHSRLTIPTMVDLQLTPMTNPVTGADELATLYKPTGFTSKTHELCATRTYRVTLDGLAYDHSGKYGEFSPFEYAPA